MKKTRISVAKNTLSRLIDNVKREETVMIFDRDTPVARLEPVNRDPDLFTTRMPELVKGGIVAPPRKPLSAAAFLARPLSAILPGAGAVRALLEEREAGRSTTGTRPPSSRCWSARGRRHAGRSSSATTRG